MNRWIDFFVSVIIQSVKVKTKKCEEYSSIATCLL